MFLFSKNVPWYAAMGLLLVSAQFWLFIFALPPFETGIWMQTEPVMIAMFATSFLDTLWLLWGAITKRLLVQKSTPLFTCLLFWVSWQIIVTLASSNSWHTWFGPIEMGEGTGWHVMILIQFMALYPLWRQPSLRRLLLGVVAISLVPQCVLHAKFPQEVELPEDVVSWAPGAWAAYLAFMVAPLWIALVTGGYLRGVWRYAMAALALAAVIIISLNKSAMVLFPLALIASSIAVWLSDRRAFRNVMKPGKSWRLLAALIAVSIPVGWTLFSAQYPAFSPNPANSFERLMWEKDGAMSTRLGFNKAGVEAMQDNPSRWLIGDGWGRFRDDLFRHVLMGGVKVYKGDERDPNWFMVDGYAFHSHNQPLEALLSLGLVGLILWFAVPIAAIISLPERYFWQCAPLLVAETILCSVWFTLPQCLPYLALGWVAISDVARTPALVPARKWSLALICGMLLMGWSGWQQWDAMMYGEKLFAANSDPALRLYDLPWIERDIERGGEHLRAVVMAAVDVMENKTNMNKNDANWLTQYDKALQAAGLSPMVGVQVASGELEMHYDVMESLPYAAATPITQRALTNFPELLDRMSERAPLRDDLATRYLDKLSDGSVVNTERQIAILRQILKTNPNHRGAMWRLGQILRNRPGHESEGAALQDRAIALGVASIYPVLPN